MRVWSEKINRKMNTTNNSKVLRELNAYIDQANGIEKFSGEKEGFSIKQDPALARNLEWIRDCYEALYVDADESFDEDLI